MGAASLILAGPKISVSIPAADKTSLIYFSLVDYVTDQYGIDMKRYEKTYEKIKRDCDPDAPEQCD